MMKSPLISIRNLDFSYNGDHQRVVNDLSLELTDGSITAILGPNGAGKTTLVHLLLGMLKPLSGEIHLKGKPLSDYSRGELSTHIAFVPQIEHTAFDFSVQEYVLMGRAPHLKLLQTPTDEDQEKVSQQLKSLDLDHLGPRSVLELSGGERQMVLIARALAQEPQLLLLDEPTTHLDLSNKGRILGTLRKLAADGVTVVFTSHDPNAAASTAQHLVLMRAGKVHASGDLGEVLTAERLSEIYGIPIQVVRVGSQSIVLLENDSG
jgi:iron complex transport system ATP-binding protein